MDSHKELNKAHKIVFDVSTDKWKIEGKFTLCIFHVFILTYLGLACC